VNLSTSRAPAGLVRAPSSFRFMYLPRNYAFQILSQRCGCNWSRGHTSKEGERGVDTERDRQTSMTFDSAGSRIHVVQMFPPHCRGRGLMSAVHAPDMGKPS
jgi:hypothetical protein